MDPPTRTPPDVRKERAQDDPTKLHFQHLTPEHRETVATLSPKKAPTDYEQLDEEEKFALPQHELVELRKQHRPRADTPYLLKPYDPEHIKNLYGTTAIRGGGRKDTPAQGVVRSVSHIPVAHVKDFSGSGMNMDDSYRNFDTTHHQNTIDANIPFSTSNRERDSGCLLYTSDAADE